MVIQLAEKTGRPKKTTLITLCDSCARATAIDCPFMREQDPLIGLAKAGIDLEDVVIKKRSSRGRIKGETMTIFQIQRCPRYKRGPLPPVKWSASF
jgi:hypothetical protein